MEFSQKSRILGWCLELIECLNCGRCCHNLVNGVWIPCRYLKRLSDGTTRCRVYYRRMGLKLEKNWKCSLRKDSPYNFTGCPYNVLFPEKPMAPGMK